VYHMGKVEILAPDQYKENIMASGNFRKARSTTNLSGRGLGAGQKILPAAARLEWKLREQIDAPPNCQYSA